ncbi:MAG TPA: CHAT domain-containing tetratricopeptide repeat protein [Thermoanaerobaculia bacterium]|nr:CHAT domain-containing tetratricopeptide repeat protein [Thermoanaerobaculia bacterium]
MRLEKGWFLDLRLQEKGVEVEVSLSDPRRNLLAMASPGAQDHRDLLLWVTEASGDYRLAVSPRDPAKPAGTYRVEIRDLRPATDKDSVRVEALKLVRQGLQEIEEEKTRRQGLAKLEQALRLCWQAGDVEEEVDTLNHIGRGFRLAGNAPAARDWYERGLTRSRETGNRRGEALSLNNIAYVSHKYLKDDTDIPELYRRSLALWKEIGDEAEQAFVLYNLGDFYLDLEKHKEAHSVFDQSLPLAESVGDLALQGKIRAGIGYVQYTQSDIKAAYQSFERAFELSEAAGDDDNAARVASNLAAVYNHLGQLQEAVEFPLDALKRVAEPETRGYVLSALGGVYLHLGKTEDALEAYRQAVEIFRTLGPGFQEWAARSLIGIGWILQLQGKPEAARLKYQEAQSLAPELGIVQYHLGLVYLDLRNPEQALALFKKVLALAEKDDDPAAIGLARLALGTAYRDLGRFHLAAEQFDRGYELASRNQNMTQMAPFLLRRAMLRRDMGRLREAQDDIEAALEAIESTRRNVAGEDLKMSYLASRRAYQEFQIDLLERLDHLHPGEGYQAQAFTASEWARARGLRDLLAQSKISLSEEVGPDLKQQEDSLLAELSRVQGLLREELQAASPSEARIASLRQELERLTEGRKRLDWEIRKRHPNPEVRPLDLPALQRGLDDRSVLLEYALGEESSFLFVVTRNGIETHKIPDAATIRERVLRLRQAIKTVNPRTRHAYFKEAHQLYRDLLAPVASVLKGKEHLLIAPDGALYLLPFEVLLTEPGEGSFKDLPYLLRSYAISYVPSASVLAELRQPRPKPAAGRLRFVAFADPDYQTKVEETGSGFLLRSFPEGTQRWSLAPLPDSRREILEIARLYPRAFSRVYLGKDAREENVKRNRLVMNAERLHIATHARPDERRPELSSLILANEEPGKGKEDGFLQAYEILRLKLSADLVVLSACETGLGEEVSGEGLVGLARSFLYAGAPSLVVSLWRISDGATPDLMVSFYEDLDRLHDKSKALRNAKLRMIEKGDYAHPFYWAPFILIGDPK